MKTDPFCRTQETTIDDNVCWEVLNHFCRFSNVLGCPIDIHTGGVDLKFPHHDNEMAQAEVGYSCMLGLCYLTGHKCMMGHRCTTGHNFIMGHKCLTGQSCMTGRKWMMGYKCLIAAWPETNLWRDIAAHRCIVERGRITTQQHDDTQMHDGTQLHCETHVCMKRHSYINSI